MSKISLYNAGYVELLDSMGNDASIVRGARICFQTDPDPKFDNGLLKTIVNLEHTSPLEQSGLIFKMKIPLFVRDQLVRHRIGMSYNIKSLRYCTASPEFYVPFFADTQAYTEWYKDCKDSFKKYEGWLQFFIDRGYSKGRAKELSRCHLPVGLYTEVLLSCNMGSMYHFWKLRCDPHAQQEIKDLAFAMFELASTVFPVTCSHISNKFSLEEYNGKENLDKINQS